MTKAKSVRSQVIRRGASVPKGSGSQYVFDTLRRKILSLEFAPGTLLEEAKLVELFGISRTPVREALIRLGAERLVVLLSNRSAQVAPLDLSDFRQYFEALDLSLRATTRWAAERRTDAQLADIKIQLSKFEDAASQQDSESMMEINRDFHLTIAFAADNEYFYETCGRLLNQGLRISRTALTHDYDPKKSLQDHIAKIIDEHRRIVLLISENRADEAEALAGAHVMLARTRAIQAMAVSNSELVKTKSGHTFS